MVQFEVYNGRDAGWLAPANRFPFSVGRNPQADLVLDEPGVWDDHFRIVTIDKMFTVETSPQTYVTINGEQIQQKQLRNGDILEIGELRLRFVLAPTRQSALRLREWATWTGLALLVIGQIIAIIALIKSV